MLLSKDITAFSNREINITHMGDCFEGIELFETRDHMRFLLPQKIDFFVFSS